MPKISSNTIVKNGMPFIGRVLRQIAPYMDKMIITLSCKSNDGTLNEIQQLVDLYPGKIVLDHEDVSSPAELTEVRNKQVSMTHSDWILFLDDDDFWPQDQLEACLKELDKDDDILAYSVSPYQLIDCEHYDSSWNNRSFSKFLRTKDLRYIKPWPRDLPADKDNSPLYWKTHPKVKKLPFRFYHLSYLKSHSFRSEKWAESFKFSIGKKIKLEKPAVLW